LGVRSVDTRERRRSPAAPFTTSKFQQDASRKLRFSVKRAMMIAQRLYEGIDLGGEEARSASSLTCVPTRRRCRTTRWQEVREY
jgi:DNA topoisomerase IA